MFNTRQLSLALTVALLIAPVACALERAPAAAIAVSLSKSIVSIRSPGMDSGTGIIISASGLVLTASPLLSDRPRSIEIRFADGRTFDADIVATDRKTESALLRIRTQSAQTFACMELGDSSTVKLGERTITAGNPLDSILADRQVAVSQGTITGAYEVSSADAASRYCGPAFETDAAINAGSEGGALLNDAGQLIGMTCLAVDQKRMLGIAIPINRIVSAYAKHLPARSPAKDVAAPAPNKNYCVLDRATQALVKIHPASSTESVSGVIIDAAGHVLTSGKFQSGQQLDVDLASGGTVRATVLRQSSDMDLSLLQLNSTQTFSWIALKENAAIIPGIQITVVDYCKLCSQPSVLTGIISAVGRLDDTAAQTDARLTASNAGSAVLNRRGDLIGVVTHTKIMRDWDAENSGVSFFTPASRICTWIDDMSKVANASPQSRSGTR